MPAPSVPLSSSPQFRQHPASALHSDGAALGHLLLVSLAAAIGGAINSIAGGGTLVTFPAIVWLGVPPLVANATSTVALWPGTAASMWGYRRELSGARAWAFPFAVPSLAGGAAGGWLLLRTPPRDFTRIVPFLVLGATVLFLVQGPLHRWARGRRTKKGAAPAGKLPAPSPAFVAIQFCIGVYGGYFGAGAGIVMLAVLGFLGFANIHRMNGLKNWGGLCMNAVAATMFAVSGIVDWPVALAMVVGALLGGYGGSRMAQRVPQPWVRRAIVAIGLAAFVWLLVRSW
ncbi:MAG TPA: sulfite exporter TauE/SafE family protein [Gemmatimonadales bacterium]|nr:sulfite exporter TauE/SafE family protein [Gemmatimonadales bacterium]